MDRHRFSHDLRLHACIRAECLHYLERHTEALREIEKVMPTFGNDPQISHAYNRAQFEVRKQKRPDYYLILGVPSIASSLEIKAAYKQRALECHPDKHAESEASRQARSRGVMRVSVRTSARIGTRIGISSSIGVARSRGVARHAKS